MALELGIGLPAAGAVAAVLLARRRALAMTAASLLGIAGFAALGLSLAGARPASVFGLALGAAPAVLLLASGLAVLLVVAFAPPANDRRWLLAAGLAGFAGLAAVAVAPDPATAGAAVLLVAAAHASIPGRRAFADRVRAPALAAALLTVGTILTHSGGATGQRLGALALALALVAIGGLLPFLPALDAQEQVIASPIAWTAFFAPAAAMALTTRVEPLLTLESAPVYAAVLVASGLINLAWGVAGAAMARDDVSAWRYSFLADWGMVLVGLGLLGGDGRSAALLMLLTIVLVRLPLYMWSRPVLMGRVERRMGTINLLAAAALAGAAPFAGFSARVLLLRAAGGVSWFLAVLLAAAMVAYIAHTARLARTLGTPTGRRPWAVAGVLIACAVAGLVPVLLLRSGGLG